MNQRASDCVDGDDSCAEDCGGDAAVADAAMAERAVRGRLSVGDLVGVLTLTDVLRRVCFEDEFLDVTEDDGEVEEAEDFRDVDVDEYDGGDA